MKPKYLGLDSYALQPFKGCHDRVRDGKAPSIFWPRSREGYIAFCIELGPKPTDMRKPSVGRIKHSKGYEPGNVRWEEHVHNSVKRRGTKWQDEEGPTVQLKTLKFKKGSPEHKAFQSLASSARWAKEGQREAASKRMIGNKYAARKAE